MLDGQLGPDALPVVGEQLLAGNKSAGSGLDGRAMYDRNGTGTVGPAAYVWGVCADGLGQCRLAAALLHEVLGEVHTRRLA